MPQANLLNLVSCLVERFTSASRRPPEKPIHFYQVTHDELHKSTIRVCSAAADFGMVDEPFRRAGAGSGQPSGDR